MRGDPPSYCAVCFVTFWAILDNFDFVTIIEGGEGLNIICWWPSFAYDPQKLFNKRIKAQNVHISQNTFILPQIFPVKILPTIRQSSTKCKSFFFIFSVTLYLKPYISVTHFISRVRTLVRTAEIVAVLVIFFFIFSILVFFISNCVE